MNFQIKEEKRRPSDYFILPTFENETEINSSHNKCSANQVIKEEPLNDFNDSDYEVVFHDEYNDETDLISENRTNNSHSTESKKLRTRATTEQVQRLIEFARNHSDSVEIQRRTDDAWNVLTAELNAMGPPTRTNLQWRRAWSVYKFNEKRRVAGNKENGRKRLRLTHPTDQADVPLSRHTRVLSMDDADTTNSTKDEDIPNANDQFHSLILEKMDSVIEQQTKHTDQLERLNTNLEKLIDIFTEKFTSN